MRWGREVIDGQSNGKRNLMGADFVTRNGLAARFQPVGKLMLGESKSLAGLFEIDRMHVTNRYIGGEACQEEVIRSTRMLR